MWQQELHLRHYHDALARRLHNKSQRSGECNAETDHYYCAPLRPATAAHWIPMSPLPSLATYVSPGNAAARPSEASASPEVKAWQKRVSRRHRPTSNARGRDGRCERATYPSGSGKTCLVQRRRSVPLSPPSWSEDYLTTTRTIPTSTIGWVNEQRLPIVTGVTSEVDSVGGNSNLYSIQLNTNNFRARLAVGLWFRTTVSDGSNLSSVRGFHPRFTCSTG